MKHLPVKPVVDLSALDALDIRVGTILRVDEVVSSNRIGSSIKNPGKWLYVAIFRDFLFFAKWENMDMKTLKKPHKLTHKLTLFHFFHFIMQISNVDVICILIDSSGKFRMAEHFRQSDW